MQPLFEGWIKNTLPYVTNLALQIHVGFSSSQFSPICVEASLINFMSVLLLHFCFLASMCMLCLIEKSKLMRNYDYLVEKHYRKSSVIGELAFAISTYYLSLHIPSTFRGNRLIYHINLEILNVVKSL